jgi:16S rRNA (cytidine1402-2'-O)-methyltransferase
VEQISKTFDKIKVESNILYIIATPIGNLGDISLRALKILSSLDIILCEDTRITGKLLKNYGIKPTKLEVYNDYSNQKHRELIINKIKNSNITFGLVSDAGTPLISDPGYKLVKECIKNSIKTTHVPGASSITTSLVLSGLPSHNFFFGGFLEKSKIQRKKQLENAFNLNSTSLWFESPNRLIETLKLMIELNNESLISVLRELTKLNEEIISGSPSIVYDQITKKAKLKGEIVLVISNNNQSHYTNEMVLDLIKKDYSKFSTKELALYISNKTGLPKKSIYNRIIELKS